MASTLNSLQRATDVAASFVEAYSIFQAFSALTRVAPAYTNWIGSGGNGPFPGLPILGEYGKPESSMCNFAMRTFREPFCCSIIASFDFYFSVA